LQFSHSQKNHGSIPAKHSESSYFALRCLNHTIQTFCKRVGQPILEIRILNPSKIIYLGAYDIAQKYNIEPETVITLDMWHTAYHMPHIDSTNSIKELESVDKNIAKYMYHFVSLCENQGL